MLSSFVCLYMVRYIGLCVYFFFFFFKQKTAYEMRISDWSSDVCSSDLQMRHVGERILDAELAALGACRRLAALKRLGRAVLQLFGQFLVEALDARQFLERNIGDFLQLSEAFGDEELRERLVDVELFLEHRRAFDEFALALLARVGLGHDVDLLAGELEIGRAHV